MSVIQRKRLYYLLGVVVALALIAGGAILWSRRGVPTVQTAGVRRHDVTAVVAASGEVRPRDYVHLTANAFGRITAIYVQEGDPVRRGQVLARLEAVQPAADVRAQQAELAAAEAGAQSAEASVSSMQANVRTAEAALSRARTQWEHAQQDFARAQALHEEQLISRSNFEQTQAEYNVAVAAVEEAEARAAQAQAQLLQVQAQAKTAQESVRRAQANLDRLRDMLTQHTFVAPIDGVVTDLPVSIGESLVPGVQNMPGSLLLTIADLSVITAEVMVDESDLGAIHPGQLAQVTVDAFPDQPFPGQVTEIGNTAVVRATGQAAAQSATSGQQAKDFKVVVTLTHPDSQLRPGLSATAEIVTATRKDTLTVPLQSLTIRRRRELGKQRPDDVTEAATSPDGTEATDRDELEGVFVVRSGQAFFQPVRTGISSISDIEVLEGLKQGDEIVTGSYEALRTLKSGERVRIDNTTAEERNEQP